MTLRVRLRVQVRLRILLLVSVCCDSEPRAVRRDEH
jgi:hypothetical protein